jgi:hypothetical protein
METTIQTTLLLRTSIVPYLLLLQRIAVVVIIRALIPVHIYTRGKGT